MVRPVASSATAAASPGSLAFAVQFVSSTNENPGGVMGGTRITLEVPEPLPQRLVEASRLTDTPLDATIIRLVEQALATDGQTAASDRTSKRDQELARIRAAL